MKLFERTKTFFLTLLLSLLLLAPTTLASADGNYGFTEAAAFDYVLDILLDKPGALEILKDVPKPNIVYLGDMNMDVFLLEQLKETYNVNCLPNFDVSECNEWLQDTVPDIIGLFLPETNIIFIRESTLIKYSECFFQSVIAHEYVHFFQVLMAGPFDGDYMYDYFVIQQREFEAYSVQRAFLEEFCTGADLPEL